MNYYEGAYKIIGDGTLEGMGFCTFSLDAHFKAYRKRKELYKLAWQKGVPVRIVKTQDTFNPKRWTISVRGAGYTYTENL
jgi:hypothetical protein